VGNLALAVAPAAHTGPRLRLVWDRDAAVTEQGLSLEAD
jgi:hypothetical protein